MIDNKTAYGDAGDLHAAELEQCPQCLAGWLAREPAIDEARHTAGDNDMYAFSFESRQCSRPIAFIFKGKTACDGALKKSFHQCRRQTHP